MTDRRLRMLEDKHLRDSARALVEADVEHIKADNTHANANRNIFGSFSSREPDTGTSLH